MSGVDPWQTVLAGIVLLGAAIAALPPIWRFVKAGARVPAIIEGIAGEFSPNGGGLREAVNRLDAALVEITRWQTYHSAEDVTQNAAVQAKIAEALDLIIERTSVIPDGSSEPKPLSLYTQDSMHRVINAFTGVAGHIPLIHTRLDKLEQLLKDEHDSVEASQVETRARVAEVHGELRTMNDLTVGQMADADERRRIVDIAPDERTAGEVQHLEDVPEPEGG